MSEVKTILLNQSVYASNDNEARKLANSLSQRGVLLVNVMSSPGAGKTTTLISLISELKSDYNIAVMEADIDSNVDAIKVADKTGVKSIQLHTGGMCHLDAGMTKQGIDELGIDDVDIIFLENVGNLVCPAEYETGAQIDMVIFSIPEGDDKPLKYPLVFKKADIVVINKIDTKEYFNFSLDKAIENIRYRNKDVEIIPISAKTGEGIVKLKEYFIRRVKEL